MRRIGMLSLVAISALAIASGFTRAATPASTGGAHLAREAQPGDDRGGNGGHGGDDIRLAREAQPGDDRGGKDA